MTLDEMLRAIFPPSAREDDLPRPSGAQRRILGHDSGPAWVIAGPGSGKTETLAILVLRLLYVDQVEAESIVVTTFTEKAARNIEDRISLFRTRLIAHHPEIMARDVSKLRIGTLHGLCNDLLQEFRAPSYENVRLMDEFESAMFVYEHLPFVRSKQSNECPDVVSFWSHFSYLFGEHEWAPHFSRTPRRWLATQALSKLFNHIVDDRASLTAMRATGGAWETLANLYDEYVAALVANSRCDFAHLQLRFLEFLVTVPGRAFRDGSGDRDGIRWVLVDEYQDTNIMQEEIYTALAGRPPYNLVVVGDDDQAMYRFRGASVECMVTFDDACATYLGIGKDAVQKYPLVENFRSHEKIVTFCNNYITAFPAMSKPGARVPGKPELEACNREITGTYPAVGIVRGATAAIFAAEFADTVEHLVKNGVVEDYSQCCLILRSTKEGPQAAGPYLAALQDRGILYYNPRNKSFLKQDEVLLLLGSVLAITDPDAVSAPPPPEQIPGGKPPRIPDLVQLVQGCRAAYLAVAKHGTELRKYVDGAVNNLGEHAGEYVPTELQELLYLLLACEPFKSWNEDDLVRRERLAKITALVEGYASLPVPNQEKVRRGAMQSAPAGERGISKLWNDKFYNLFLGYLAQSGMNDDEDDEIIFPRGRVPIMTIHQAKGLEFPFVFVGSLGATADGDKPVYLLEDEFAKFPGNADRTFERADSATRAELDIVRSSYVAFSRAEWALILVGSNTHFQKGAIPCGPDRTWLRYQAVKL